MLFGVVLPRYDVSFHSLVRAAISIQQLGYDSLWVTDHLQPRRGSTALEAWTVLSSMAVVTNRIRLGSVVLCYSYRHPAVLAKMAATLDHLSGGRLELGLGAGSEQQDEEHAALGIPFLPASERIKQFREYVDVIRLLLSCSGSVSYEGNYYVLREATCNNPPIQKAAKPIWIGARRRKMLEVAAEIGEGLNLYCEDLDELAQSLETFNSICDARGVEPGRVRKSVFTSVLAYGGQQFGEKLRTLGTELGSFEDFRRRTYMLLHGGVDEIITTLEKMEEMGISLVILRDLERDMPSIKTLAEEVLPSFKR